MMDDSWRLAATRLKHLATLVRRKENQRIPRFGCDALALEPFFMLFPVNPPPDLVRFLCEITPDETIHLGVHTLLSVSDLYRYQIDAAPVEDNTRFALMALGYWTGESDGDAWIYDLRAGTIHSLDVCSGYEGSREATLQQCYLHFETLGQWVDFLVADVVRREWLDEADIPLS